MDVLHLGLNIFNSYYSLSEIIIFQHFVKKKYSLLLRHLFLRYLVPVRGYQVFSLIVDMKPKKTLFVQYFLSPFIEKTKKFHEQNQAWCNPERRHILLRQEFLGKFLVEMLCHDTKSQIA